MRLTFDGDIWYWRGPAPFYFVTVPDDHSVEIQAVAPAVTYGWGMIPVGVRIGSTTWETSLWPKDDLYVVPVKTWVRAAEDIDEGDVVTVELTVKGID